MEPFAYMPGMFGNSRVQVLCTYGRTDHMAHKLNDARRSLERAKEAAEARLKEIEHERREIKASLKSLDAAMKALDGPGRRTPIRKQLVIRGDAAGQAPEQG